MTKQTYTAADIDVLSERDHVRLRTQIVLGNTEPTIYKVPLFLKNQFKIEEIEFIPAVYKAVGEIIDNSLDEFAQTTTKGKCITIDAHPILGMYTISDNGRGVPIEKHQVGHYTPQVVFNQLRSGRNFKDEKQIGVIGQNGVGSACVNFCSTEFKVDIHRDGKRYRQTFNDGGANVSRPSIRKSDKDSGTTVEFQLDSEVFKDITLPDKLMENRAMEIALTNPGITTEYNKKKYRFPKGFESIIRKISTNYFKFETQDVEFFVIFDVNKNLDEEIFTWVNSSLLFDGGICNTQFLNALYSKSIESVAKEAKKRKCEVTKNDVRNNLLVIGNLKISDPQYDAQSKTRLTGPNLRAYFDGMINRQWSSFTKNNKKWLEEVIERAMVRHHHKEDKTAVEEHKKSLSKKIPKLVDATSRDRSKCQLLVTEGDSAARMITQARDPKIHASLPLSGKINNVYGITVAQLLRMGKISDLLAAIGLVPGRKPLRSELNYGRVIIATDADFDGSDIFTLLVNLFYTFWSGLFDPNYDPFIYRLVAPNVCAVKGNKRIHFSTRAEYEKVKSKYKNWTINYYKGLGSMAPQDWKMILSGETNTLIPIQDDDKMVETLELLFSPNAEARKDWLREI